jgi:hypothetical protein
MDDVYIYAKVVHGPPISITQHGQVIYMEQFQDRLPLDGRTLLHSFSGSMFALSLVQVPTRISEVVQYF